MSPDEVGRIGRWKALCYVYVVKCKLLWWKVGEKTDISIKKIFSTLSNLLMKEKEIAF